MGNWAMDVYNEKVDEVEVDPFVRDLGYTYNLIFLLINLVLLLNLVIAILNNVFMKYDSI